MLFYYTANLIIISLKINLFSPWYSWKVAELALNNNNSLTHFFLYESETVDGHHKTKFNIRSYGVNVLNILFQKTLNHLKAKLQ
jgi:hypothetical protein